MKAKLFLIASILSVGFFISVCADEPIFHGNSLASGTLQKDTFATVRPTLEKGMKYKTITVANTVFQNYFDKQGKATDKYDVIGANLISPWAEVWTVKGCGDKAVLGIKFTPDPDPTTGTTYAIEILE